MSTAEMRTAKYNQAMLIRSSGRRYKNENLTVITACHVKRTENRRTNRSCSPMMSRRGAGDSIPTAQSIAICVRCRTPIARPIYTIQMNSNRAASSDQGTPVLHETEPTLMTHFLLRMLRNGAVMMVLSPCVVIVVWQLLVNIGVMSLDSFTSPARVFYALVDIVTQSNPALRGSLATHIWASLQEVVLGFVCAAGVGVPLGLLMGWNRVARNILDPIVELLRPIPPGVL